MTKFQPRSPQEEGDNDHADEDRTVRGPPEQVTETLSDFEESPEAAQLLATADNFDQTSESDLGGAKSPFHDEGGEQQCSDSQLYYVYCLEDHADRWLSFAWSDSGSDESDGQSSVASETSTEDSDRQSSTASESESDTDELSTKQQGFTTTITHETVDGLAIRALHGLTGAQFVHLNVVESIIEQLTSEELRKVILRALQRCCSSGRVVHPDWRSLQGILDDLSTMSALPPDEKLTYEDIEAGGRFHLVENALRQMQDLRPDRTMSRVEEGIMDQVVVGLAGIGEAAFITFFVLRSPKSCQLLEPVWLAASSLELLAVQSVTALPLCWMI
ncbi:hypothetical protein H2201_002969 [Coniosporium apollinis]|uniref:Uncharacterized protein n=1 Tax=Coniosporium apollinis TaxID=61459 RepID=A0ABQ9NZU7_9PEZI|nr:hypothetical protein H2201_002969 [Coniosporium apollinis]